MVTAQPILDAHKKLVAHSWSLHPRSGQGLVDGDFSRFWQMPELRIQLSQGLSLLHLPLTWLDESHLAQVDDWSRLVLVLDVQAIHDAPRLRAAKAARQQGASLALAGFDGSEDAWKLLPAVQYVKVDTQQLSAAVMAQLLTHEVLPIAVGVDSEERFTHDLSAGCRWFEGRFFTRPLMSEQHDSVNRATLLRVLAQLNDPKADLAHLAEVVGQDVALTHQLLASLNSAAMALPAPVHSLADAIRFLGTKRLAFWVSVLMLSQMEDAPPALLYTALARARFMEQLAELGGARGQKDAWFLSGLFSTLDAFLRVPMADAVADMPLAEDIRDALLHQVGDMGYALALALALEGVGASVDMAFAGMDVCALSMLYVESAGWAYAVWSQPAV